MGFVPRDAKWFLADIVLQITVEGDPCSVIHTNLVLVRADSSEEAFERATELGVRSESSYANPAGKTVKIKYRSLHDLNVIHEDLQHGAELTYTEHIGSDEAAIQQWVVAKDDLAVFAAMGRDPRRPDYGSHEVLENVLRNNPNLRRVSSEADT